MSAPTFGSFAHWTRNRPRPTPPPTQQMRLAADALGWVGDVEDLLARGACCTCAPEYRCPLHERIDYAVDCIRLSSGAAL